MKVNVGNIVEFYKKYPEYIGSIKVNTRYGFKSIEYADITAKDSLVYLIETETRKIKTSPDHLLFTTQWIKVKDLSIGDSLETISGLETINNISILEKKDDLYDLQVEDVKEYYANGFVSHNSTLLDALMFSLYGKPFRKIKLQQMLNVRNQKGMLVSLDFKIGSNQYRIERGIKPKVFNIYENDKSIDQVAAAKDQQDYLETHILKMNEKSFRQIVVLGSAAYNPFMRLNTHEKRVIVEELLGIQLFSIMNTLNRDIISSKQNEFKEKDHIIQMKEQELVYEEKIWDEANQNRESQINDLMSDRQKYENEVDKILKLVEKKREDVEQYIQDLQLHDKDKHEAKIDRGNEMRVKLEYEKNKLNKRLKFFEKNNVCPSCEQNISEMDSINHISECQTKITELSDNYGKLSIIIDKETNILDGIQVKIELIRKEQHQINLAQSKIKTNQKQIDHYNKKVQELMDKSDVVLDDSIVEIEKDLDKLRSNFSKIKKELYHRSIISNMLKDDGIKSRLIDNYLPKLNSYINKFLKVLGSTISLNLNNKFDEVIKTRGREELKYESFSEGEKQRIDLAILFAFREISGLLNNSTNLLILDETMDSSLDNNGVDAFLDIIRALENTSVVVISHKGGNIFDKFQRAIEVKKNINGFTEYTELE